MRKDYQILLFYCYAEIKNTEIFKSDHHLFCIKNNIKGRIIISSEGINGTVSGLKEDCDKNKNGVAKQCSIQSPDDTAPI